MTRRLLWSTRWQPDRTLVAAAIGGPATLHLVGLANLDGLTGTTEHGGIWTVTSGAVATTRDQDIR
jgi:hypothetical protein